MVIAMSDKLLQIIEKKVDLFISPSFVDLGFKTSNLIKPMKPDDLRRISSIIDKFILIVGQTINYHSEETIKIIKTALIESGIEVTQELSDRILKLTDSKINTPKYLDRFPNLLGMIGRHYSRLGIKFDRSKYRLDISLTKYEVLVKNLVRRNSEKLKTELNILCLSTSQRYSGKVSTKLTMNDANKEVDQMPDTQKVFVVHGRDGRLRDDFFSFLRTLCLQPIEWSEALKLTGKATPYIGEALESAFENAQAVIVLLTPDDEVRLSPALWTVKEDENEKNIKLQARPNVLFEAGMAFGTHPDRTLLIEVGQVKAFSDVAGRHVIRLSNSSEKRNEIAERLRTAGCDVTTSGSDWLNTGDFTVARENKAESFRYEYKQTDLNEGDILALLDDWWPKSKDSVPENVKVNFNKLDELISLPPGSTKKYIGQIATRKSFKCGPCGNVFAIFEYDVTINDFGTYLEPDSEPSY